MKTYRFDYIAWIPSYRDTDIDWTFVIADSEEQAIEKFQQLPIFKFISPTMNKYAIKPTVEND